MFPVLASLNHTLVVTADYFPAWLRISHLINIIFIGLMIRSGIQILGAHPRLYWKDGSDPKREWLRVTSQKIPRDRLYTSMDDEIPVTPWLATPGGDNLGLGRHWHFFCAIFWFLNGLAFYILLAISGLWRTLVPTSWSIIPGAWHAFVIYISGHIPPESSLNPFDPLQQLAYFGVIYILGPLMILWGAAQSPAIEARFPWYVKMWGGRQSVRSLHFLGMLAFIAFILVHTALIFYVYFPDNITNIVFGIKGYNFTWAWIIGLIVVILIFAFYAWTSWFSMRHKRGMQHALGAVVDPTRKVLLHREVSKQHYKKEDRTSYFWVNGRPPVSEEYEDLARYNFVDYRLHVCGLVEHELDLSLEDLKALPKQTQTTMHNCIQGWTGIAEWGGVCVSEVLKLCKPLPNAKYMVSISYQKGKQSVKPELTEAHDHTFYEVIDLTLANHPETILAYEMNDQPLSIEHGAPLRLRVETLLGYKMVKFIKTIELVEDYSQVGLGQGGFREDFQYYGRGAEI
jgi:sulfoxide reductase catalytic subunit YedY